jgi:hypothetical protein
MRVACACVCASRTHKAGGSENIGPTNTYPMHSMRTGIRTDREAWCSCACACVQDAQPMVIRRCCCTCIYIFDAWCYCACAGVQDAQIMVLKRCCTCMYIIDACARSIPCAQYVRQSMYRSQQACARASRTHNVGGSDDIGCTNTYHLHSMCTGIRADREVWCSCPCACVQDGQIMVLSRCCTSIYIFDACAHLIDIHLALSMCTSVRTDHSRHACGWRMRASRTHKAGGSDNIGRTSTYPSYSMCTSTRTDHSRDA